MQVVILAGGLGTRLAEETDLIPKPMVRIGPDPIILHLMKYFASFGHNEFLIAAGYKSEVIEKFFSNHSSPSDWDIKVQNTGEFTATGGRLVNLAPQLRDEFFLTYGDGLGDINLDALYKHHKDMNTLLTVTAVRPPARFGSLQLSGGLVSKFSEKDSQDVGWINGGFFVCSKRILEFISNQDTSLEREPINRIVQLTQLSGYEHHGWWHPMDTLRDKRLLEELWNSGNPPWKRGE